MVHENNAKMEIEEVQKDVKALITGANGHLGYNLVKLLLEKGYDVRGSVRSLEDTNKVQWVAGLGDVEVVEARLDDRESLRNAMEGIDILFHAAAIYQLANVKDEDVIVKASVEGIRNAFEAAAECGVKKIVLTSSIASLPMVGPGDPPTDERHWREDVSAPYFRAKTQGEQLAWELSENLGLNLVSILPASILGPGFLRNTPSIDLIEVMMSGAFRMGVPKIRLPIVDVRDTAYAHLLAAEKDCQGRFIVCNDHHPTLKEMMTVMNEIDPSIGLPMMTLPGFFHFMVPFLDRMNHWMLGTPLTTSPEINASMKGKFPNPVNHRIKEKLGWKPSIPIKKSFEDTIARILDLKKKPDEENGL